MRGGFIVKIAAKKVCKGMLLWAITLIAILSFSINVWAASTPYEVTKSGGALIRTSYSESASSVRRAATGSIVWVVSSKKNSAGNTWYKLSDGYWIYSKNVKKHSCSWSWVSGNDPTCTASGVQNYKCNKCGQTKKSKSAAYGHNYSGNVCTRCGDWNTSSLKSKSTVNNVKYCVVSQSAKVRSGPYEKCSAVNTLYKGTDIVVTQKVVNAMGNTWYKYSGGYIYSDHVKSHNSCAWNSGNITQNATCTSTGTKVQTCTICGKTKSTTISKTGHQYSGNVCTGCGCWDTSSLKSKKTIDNVKYCVVSQSAKVRSGPYEKCSAVNTLYKGTDIVVTQKVVNAMGNTWYKYSGGYIFEDHVKNHSSCSWDSGKVTQKATCISTGTKVQKCKVCEKEKTTTIAKAKHSYKDSVCTGCGCWDTSSLKSKSTVNNVKYCVVSQSAKVRSGPYEKCGSVKTVYKGTDIVITEKVVNAQGNTWYKCSDGYIFEDHVKKHTSCSWDSGKVTKKATCIATGTKVQTCTLCGKTKTTTVEKTNHSYKDYVCTTCGVWKTSSLKSKKKIDNVEYCAISGSAKIRSGPYEDCSVVKKIAKGTDIVITQKVVNAKGSTWYKCSDGYIFEDHVKKHTSCSWDSGKVTKKATCTATGTKEQQCKICEKTKVTTLSKTKHSYKDYVCKKCGAWKTSSLESKTKIDNVEYCVVSKSAKIRSGPYENCSVVKKVSKGEIIVVTQKVVNAEGNTWYKCSDGYVYGDRVATHKFVCGICRECDGKLSENCATAQIILDKLNDKKVVSVAVDFADELFLKDSKAFSDKLCRISAAGMAVSYNVNYSKLFFESCGFDYIEAHNSSSKKSTVEDGKNDHARYIVGWKKINGTDTVLVGVLVNGYTADKYEWISNFNIGESGLHKGFSIAANEVTQKVNEYIKKQKIDISNMKIWITGHSRGGVVTGMTAANLSYKYGVENIFAYGFATPNGVPTEMANSVPNDTSKTVCTDNIFNIVNKSDFVPYVVPEDWDFTKYGRTIELGVGAGTKAVYKDLTGNSYKGLKISKREDIIDDFCDFSPDRIAYYEKDNGAPSKFGKGLGLVMCGDEAGKSMAASSNPLLAATMWANKPKITISHCAETYLVLVDAQTPSKHLKTESDCKVCNP